MEQHSDLQNTNDFENVSSSHCNNSADGFNMKECKDALVGSDTDIQVSHETKIDSDTNAQISHEAKNDSDDEYCDANDNSEEFDIDDENLEDMHKNLSDEELQKLKDEAICFKNSGNEYYKNGDHKESVSYYTKAINKCPLKFPSDRSILFSNRAAARISLEMNDDAILDCNKAIELNPDYLKAILRRAQLHRKMDNLERSLDDYKRVMELDPNNAESRASCATLPAEIAEKNEKLKDEMLGKLKELGNICLKPFGLSTENFQMVQDPNTGGYSINFQGNNSK